MGREKMLKQNTKSSNEELHEEFMYVEGCATVCMPSWFAPLL